MGNGTVSIIIPIWQPDVELFRRAIASIRSQDASADGFETILCFDGTETAGRREATAIAEGAGLNLKVVVHRRNQGMAAARNSCAQAAGGEWLLLLDHDDELAHDAVSRLRRSASGEDDLIFSDYVQVTREGRELFRSNAAAYYELMAKYSLHWQNPMWHATFILQALLIRRATFLRLGGFSEEAGLSHEVDFRARLYRGTNIRYVPETLYKYVSRADSVYHTRYDELVRATEKTMQRHARRIGMEVVMCRRLGKVSPYNVTHYGFWTTAGERVEPEWVDYNAMALR